MPTAATAKLPRPKSEDEFEDIVLNVLRIRWGDRNATRNGRRGQGQQGVDVFGKTGEGHVGAQVKNRDTVTVKEIESEVLAAEKFTPALARFYFVISGSRDARLQEEVRALCDQRVTTRKFPVELLFWEDVCHELASQPQLVAKFWPQFHDSIGDETNDVADELISMGIFGDVPTSVLAPEDSRTPEIHVLMTLRGGPEECAAVRYFKLWLFAPVGIRVDSIEPDNEDAFLALVRRHFLDDAGAALEPPSDAYATVENRAPNLEYHRRWRWWRHGVVAMASTLQDLHRAGTYSVADLVVDMLRMFAFTVDAAPRGVGGIPMGPVQVVLAYDPGNLSVVFDPSDVRAREKLHASLGGVRGVGRPAYGEPGEHRVTETVMMDKLAREPHGVVAALLVPLLRKVHKARIDTREFADSLQPLMVAVADARRQ